jgi:nicotinamide-nucleotide amidase
MFAELISIGDELLIGQVINTNAAWMADQLNSTGIDIKQITSVSDKQDEILRALHEATGRADVILITGGLGPTKDDITKQVLCDFFNTHLITDQVVLSNVEAFFAKRGVRLNELNRQQALVPAGCIVISNPVGTAPGLAFEKKNKLYVAMPGVPYEMKGTMESWVLPRLRDYQKDFHIVHRTVLTQGIGESFLADIIEDWENNLPSNIKLAYLPSPGIVRLRLTARGNDKTNLEEQLNEGISDLKKIIPGYFWGLDNDKLESVIGKLLRELNFKLATAESCTGGYIAHRITSIPGSSDYFKGSVVAYDNRVKENLLKVNSAMIIKHGAVSREVAEQMAAGVRKLLQADYSISVTGIAGPDGGTLEKPVGTVWIAIASSDETISKKFQFGDERERNIIRSANAALGMLVKILSKKRAGMDTGSLQHSH